MKLHGRAGGRAVATLGCFAAFCTYSLVNPAFAHASGTVFVYTRTGALRGSYTTIQGGATVAEAGDTVVISGGTYAETVNPKKDGTATDPIVFTNAVGEQVVITGTGLASSTESLFNLKYRSNIHLRGSDVGGNEGIKVVNAPNYGIFGNGVTGISISDIEVAGTQDGGIVLIDGTSVTIKGSDVHHTNQAALVTGNPGSANNEAVTINNIDTFSVSENWVHDCAEEGIDAKYEARYGSIRNNRTEGNAGPNIYIDAAHDITIANNLVRGTTTPKAGIGLAVESESPTQSLSQIMIVNNIVVNNGGGGISFWKESGGSLSNVTVINNTLHGNAAAGIVFASTSLGTGNIIRNTILAGNGAPTSTSTSGFVMDHNLASGSAGYVDAPGGDFHLSSTSTAARDKGSSVGAPSYDYDWLARPAIPGDQVDIGAYERD